MAATRSSESGSRLRPTSIDVSDVSSESIREYAADLADSVHFERRPQRTVLVFD